MLTNYQYNPITGFRKDIIKTNNEYEINGKNNENNEKNMENGKNDKKNDCSPLGGRCGVLIPITADIYVPILQRLNDFGITWTESVTVTKKKN